MIAVVQRLIMTGMKLDTSPFHVLSEKVTAGEKMEYFITFPHFPGSGPAWKGIFKGWLRCEIVPYSGISS